MILYFESGWTVTGFRDESSLLSDALAAGLSPTLPSLFLLSGVVILITPW